MTGAYVLTEANRRFGWAAIPLAALISFSRLYLFVHFPSDVLAAALLGLGVGFAACRAGKYSMKRAGKWGGAIG